MNPSKYESLFPFDGFITKSWLLLQWPTIFSHETEANSRKLSPLHLEEMALCFLQARGEGHQLAGRFLPPVWQVYRWSPYAQPFWFISQVHYRARLKKEIFGIWYLWKNRLFSAVKTSTLVFNFHVYVILIPVHKWFACLRAHNGITLISCNYSIFCILIIASWYFES